MSELSYQAKNQWVLGKIAGFPAIDIQNEFILSVSENGKGFVNTIRFNNRNVNDLSGRRKKSAGHQTVSTPSVRNSNRRSLGSSNLIDFEEVGKFIVGDKKIKDLANAVF